MSTDQEWTEKSWRVGAKVQLRTRISTHTPNQPMYLEVEEVSEGGDEAVGPKAGKHQNAIHVRGLEGGGANE